MNKTVIQAMVAGVCVAAIMTALGVGRAERTSDRIRPGTTTQLELPAQRSASSPS